MKDSDLDVYGQVFILKEYEPLIKLVAKRNDEKGIKTIVDVGANTGLTSIYLNHFYKSAMILAVEPDFENFRLLQLNCKSITEIRCSQVAIWEKKEKLMLSGKNFRDGNSWSKTFALIKNESNLENQVQGLDLLTLLSENGIDQVDILKIDIEGAERHIFHDPEKLSLLLSKTRYLTIEVHEEFISKRDVIVELMRNGFDFEIHNETIFAYKR